MDDFAVMNEEYAKVFGGEPPARSAVAVHQLPLGALVEIEAWVHRPGHETGSGAVVTARPVTDTGRAVRKSPRAGSGDGARASACRRTRPLTRHPVPLRRRGGPVTIDRLVGTTTAARETRPAMPTEEPHHPGRRRLPRVPVWTPWVVAPVVVLVLYEALPAPNDLRSHYQASGVALVSAPALAWLLTRRAPLAHHAAAALTACILPVLTLISLHGTNYFFAGIIGDQSFRLEYAARFASDLGSLTDYTYDVPAFYSPGWFWTVGATSVATGEPVWRIYKWVAIASMFLAVLLAFLLWRRSCGTRLSALLVTVTTIGLPSALLPWLGRETLLLAGAYESYSWLVALPLPALLTWFAMGGDRFSPRRGVVLGVLLGLAAWVYLLYTAVA